MIHDERWSERLSRSVAAAVLAGMTVFFFAFALGLVLSMVTDADPEWIAGSVMAWWGLILFGLVLAGILFGLATAVPLHLAMLWMRPRGRGRMFVAGAAGIVAAGFGALAMRSEALSMPLLLAALLVATGLAGVYFSAMLERWTWTEPCAS